MPVSSEIFRTLGTYLKAQAQNALIVILLYVAAFAITGMPWWAITGIVCGILNLFPHLGPVIALGLALLVKWSVTDDIWKLIYVLGAWLVIQIVDGFVLSPRASVRAGLNPFVSILVTLAAGLMFGPIGMILAVPVVAIILIVKRAVLRPVPQI